MMAFSIPVGVVVQTGGGSSVAANQLPPDSYKAIVGLGDIVVTAKVHPPAPPPGAVGKPYYPEKAHEELAEGSAVLRCDLSEAGAAPTNCVIIAETPTGREFGEAALALAPRLHPSTQFVDDGVIIIPFTFKFDGPAKYPNPRWVDNPDWQTVPDTPAMEAALKRYAPALKGPAWSVVQCEVATAGTLSKCQSLMTSPEGMGVGDAAASLSAKFAMRPSDLTGQRVAGARVLIKLRLNP